MKNSVDAYPGAFGASNNSTAALNQAAAPQQNPAQQAEQPQGVPLQKLGDNAPQKQPIHCIADVMMVSDSNEIDSELVNWVIQYYSSLSKLLRVIARVIRFMKSPTISSRKEIDSDDMKHAKDILIRYVQKDLNLANVKKLKPFKDDKGLVRVHSRLSNICRLISNFLSSCQKMFTLQVLL